MPPDSAAGVPFQKRAAAAGFRASVAPSHLRRSSLISDRRPPCRRRVAPLRRRNIAIVHPQILAYVSVRVAVEQRADQAAVEVAGAEQRVADREGEVEIPRLHEPGRMMDDVHPPHSVDERNVLQIGVVPVVEVGQRVEAFIKQVIGSVKPR